MLLELLFFAIGFRYGLGGADKQVLAKSFGRYVGKSTAGIRRKRAEAEMYVRESNARSKDKSFNEERQKLMMRFDQLRLVNAETRTARNIITYNPVRAISNASLGRQVEAFSPFEIAIAKGEKPKVSSSPLSLEPGMAYAAPFEARDFSVTGVSGMGDTLYNPMASSASTLAPSSSTYSENTTTTGGYGSFPESIPSSYNAITPLWQERGLNGEYVQARRILRNPDGSIISQGSSAAHAPRSLDIGFDSNFNAQLMPDQSSSSNKRMSDSKKEIGGASKVSAMINIERELRWRQKMTANPENASSK